MDTIIKDVLSPSDKPTIPKLPQKITQKDAQLLEQAVSSNYHKKMESNILRILLAEAYVILKNEKSSRILTEINIQAFQGTPILIDARMRLSMIIIDSFDQYKVDIVRTQIMEVSNSISQPIHKNQFELVKAGLEALKENYYKAALGYLSAYKDQTLVDDEERRVNVIEKVITLSLLAEKSRQLHQLICQLLINPDAKKSPCYPLVSKLYAETMIDESDIEPVKRILPLKFDKKNSQNISILNKVIFKHNMQSIIKCFTTISLQILGELVNLKGEDLLIMIEKSFTNKEVQVDQISGYLTIKSDNLKDQLLIKGLFDNIEDLINTQN